MNWRIHHCAETVSTNIDARDGAPGDVFTADYQTCGRGRLDHRWLSPAGTNLLMSAVVGVEGMDPVSVSTLPLTAGLAVIKAMPAEVRGEKVSLKWPNDILLGRRKLAGILCERHGDIVVVGIGVNVKKQEFPPEIAERATFLGGDSVEEVRDRILASLGRCLEKWRGGGFAAIHPEVAAVDALRGRTVSVTRTDDDAEPVRGICGGITFAGALDVGGIEVYAGEAHIGEVA